MTLLIRCMAFSICAVAGFYFTAAVTAQSELNSRGFSNIPQSDEAAHQANQPFGAPILPTNRYVNDGIEDWAWYAIPAVREQLNLSQGQLDQLNRYYGAAWTRYNQDLYALDANLAEPQRIQGQQDLSGIFHRDLMYAVDNVFTDPAASLRFNQLFLQYRWYAALTDQFIQQQLNLTVAQQRIFRQFDQGWDEQMSDWYEIYPSNPIAVRSQFESSRRDFQDNVHSVLSPQQWQLWQTLVGEPFDFTPNDYFQYEPIANLTSEPVEMSSDSQPVRRPPLKEPTEPQPE